MFFAESASSEDEESDYNYCCQAFSSVSSALGIRSQPSYLLDVPLYDAVSADRITFKQSQVVCVSHSICAYLWLVMLTGYLHDYYLLFYLLALAFLLNTN